MKSADGGLQVFRRAGLLRGRHRSRPARLGQGPPKRRITRHCHDWHLAGFADRVLSLRVNSKPSIPGMFRSVTTMSGTRSNARSSACRPLCACSTRKPAWVSHSAYISPPARSSSTSRTLGPNPEAAIRASMRQHIRPKYIRNRRRLRARGSRRSAAAELGLRGGIFRTCPGLILSGIATADPYWP